MVMIVVTTKRGGEVKEMMVVTMERGKKRRKQTKVSMYMPTTAKPIQQCSAVASQQQSNLVHSEPKMIEINIAIVDVDIDITD
jgi:hypothetical protein